jgi:hypothetical protein
VVVRKDVYCNVRSLTGDGGPPRGTIPLRFLNGGLVGRCPPDGWPPEERELETCKGRVNKSHAAGFNGRRVSSPCWPLEWRAHLD